VLRLDGPRDFALRTLSRLLENAWDGEEALGHVIAYGDGTVPEEHIAGTLDDYAFTILACIDVWLGGGDIRFYRTAVKIADVMIARFYDHTAGAFYDAAAPEKGTVPLGALAARRKPLQDSPTPAGNPTAASALIRLEALSGRTDYNEIAEDTLGTFAGVVEHFGLYAGSYGLALERLLLGPLQVVVVGTGAGADSLEATATLGYAVHKTVIRLAPEQLTAANLPEALAETVLQVPAPAGVEAWALVCRGRTCFAPVSDADALLQTLQQA
jgi:hypothetical protein